MLREWLVLRHLSDRRSMIPRLVELKFWRAQLHIEYIPGERLLEWVLKRYSPPDTDIGNFQNVHGLTTDPIISDAFARFRRCDSCEANSLRLAVRESYAALHALGWIHGSADPRNMIVNDGRVFIIDFDHARPCRDPRSLEWPNLREWYGL
jgi:tRNA A-37 threonylcarbamoyl transferase component Bud32